MEILKYGGIECCSYWNGTIIMYLLLVYPADSSMHPQMRAEKYRTE